MNGIQTYNFHGQAIVLINESGTPIVAMKPIVEGMGLEWERQRKKLNTRKAKFSTTVHMVGGSSADGKNREMVCIPLKKLPGWLFSINAEKVPNPTLRAKVELYQEECFQTLYDYWFNGFAARTNTPSTERALQVLECIKPKAPPGLISEVNGEPRNRIVRSHFKSRKGDRAKGIQPPPLFRQSTIFDYIEFSG